MSLLSPNNEDKQALYERLIQTLVPTFTIAYDAIVQSVVPSMSEAFDFLVLNGDKIIAAIEYKSIAYSDYPIEGCKWRSI